MKKYVLILIFLVFEFQAFAQLSNGSIAPDFTVIDINGNQHNLYNYLNSGKTVILEFSGVGCGASWKYLRTEALQDFYNAYGLVGSNEVVVLFIEDGTEILPLQGISNPPAFGNWIKGTPFPIILNSNLRSLYEINYDPTIYMICPNKKIKTIGQPTAISCLSLVNNCSLISGVQNHVKLLDNINGFCDSNGSFKVKIKNYGSNNVTSVRLKLKENNNVISTKTFNMYMFQFSEKTLEFDPISINTNANYTVELESVNNTSNYTSLFSLANLPFYFASVSELLDIKVKVYTYSCPNKMSWEITNSAGIIVATGGPYGIPESLCNGPSNSIVEHDILLPSNGDCYNLSLKSQNGLGWKNYQGNAVEPTNSGIEFYSNGTLIYKKMNVENFGSVLEIKNFLIIKDNDVTENKDKRINIFPNPSDGIFQINSDLEVSIRIIDLVGNVIFSNIDFDYKRSVDLSKVNEGIYFVESTDKYNNVRMQKIILNKF